MLEAGGQRLEVRSWRLEAGGGARERGTPRHRRKEMPLGVSGNGFEIGI
jgi:hypothetical protein